jgi:hypothetical protein
MAAAKPVRDASEMQVEGGPAVGMITEQGLRLFEAKRKAESKKAEALGVAMEKTHLPVVDTAPRRS